ncbi:hypothetical protein MKZ38_000768 [Zalerion maritima]|uniref:Aminoglycoside phosphotransferase domain-containing protein n=1 Tax=Zalerion maritima TaxID=339359 RepID=A0AAD5RF63_9PEZI|nr:hypothetical protein MKZ38_000768 [Zalerion maritima]
MLTGAFLIAERYPSTEVTGTDLSPVQPELIPPNLQFYVDDIEDEWVDHCGYDLVHLRHVAPFVRDMPRLLRHTKPGGWIEIQECSGLPSCDDETMPENHPVTEFFTRVHAALAEDGMNFHVGPALAQPFRVAGFTSILCRGVRKSKMNATDAAYFMESGGSGDNAMPLARELAGDNVVPVEVQGVCSYSVYAGPELEYVVQFRLESLAFKTEITFLATKVYGSLAPKVSFEGKVGDGAKESLYVYLMSRVRGITHLDFILAHGFPDDSPDNQSRRKNLISDVAHFMALSWKAPQPVSPEYRGSLGQTYLRDLRLLHTVLPSRFQSIVRTCIDSMDDILSLPMVLLHRNFGTCNIMVDKATCHLVGIVDWAEAKICPFGLNLHSLQSLTGKLHLRNGWTRFEDYDTLQDVFWERFKQEIGGLSNYQLRTIKLARALGLLLSRGFTSRLANESEPAPIGDDEQGRYNMMSLNGFLIDPKTKFDGLDELGC